jgi:choline dehydrogenase
MSKDYALTEDASFDYIIVGAGSAGSVLANRLSANPDVKVLLLEAGPDEEPFWVRVPAGSPFLYFNERYNWKSMTEPEPNLGNRAIYQPRGKLLGGSSSINGMAYHRGEAADYDAWRLDGNSGWSWKDVLPYFIRSENNARGGNEFHGAEGPLQVCRASYTHPIMDAFVKSGEAAGLPFRAEIHGGRQEGVAYMQHTVGAGVRSSAANAFLKPIRKRANLTIVADALVEKIDIKDRRAFAVCFRVGDQPHRVRANLDIILSAGAIGTPQILMLSGVGPADHLKAVGVPVVLDCPGVGSHLQDHLSANVMYETRAGMSLNNQLRGFRKYVNGARYLLNKTGPLSLPVSHAVAFTRASASALSPDIQITFRAWSFDFNSKTGRLSMHSFPGIQFAAQLVNPLSRGTVRLRSANPKDQPRIQPNYLSAPEDPERFVAGVKWVRRIAHSLPLKDLIVREVAPGPQYESDEQILDFVRKTSTSVYHPTGTCKMGQAEDAVVDERLRVYGIEGLRVVDASIMPSTVRGNTNAPVMMIGERASDLIIEDRKAPERRRRQRTAPTRSRAHP